MSTLEAINGSINELLPQLKFELVSDGEDNWSLRDGSGTSIPFCDGISIPTNADNPLAVAAERVRIRPGDKGYHKGVGQLTPARGVVPLVRVLVSLTHIAAPSSL